MGRKPNVSTTPVSETQEQVVVGENEETKTVDTVTQETPVSETQEQSEPKDNDKPAKKVVFDDDKDYEIISKTRAGKSIIANDPEKVVFDEKGKATVKGKVARYLVESGLGFELAK